MSDIIRRIEQETGIPDIVTTLANRLEPADLHSLLQEVYRRRSLNRSPATVLAEYKSSRFVQLGRTDPRLLLEWDRCAFSTLPDGFEAMELSPLCPLGTNSAVATVSQDKSVVTARNLEVVSDSTNVLALECGVRRQQLLAANPRSSEAVRLATSHRVLRPQFSANPRMLPHFRLFSLCSAGRDTGSSRFENAMLAEHVGFYLTALTRFLNPDASLRVSLTDLASETPRETWLSVALGPLREQFRAVDFCFDQTRTAGRGYYTTVCFKIHETSSDAAIELADGGVVDWTQQLLNNAKERLFISAIGSERVCALKGSQRS